MVTTTVFDAVIEVREVAPVTLMPGKAGQARVTVAVTNGYHVQANPASSEFFVPTRLQLRAKGGVLPQAPVYPPGKSYRLEGMPEDLMTYEETFDIFIPLEVNGSAPTGDRVLKGSLHYQACDNVSCLFPASVPVTIPVRVVAD
ncbi:MAG: protein-disulfide reductase DsbD domain-containing protein [Dehalococcoidia bacterium]